MSSILNLFRGKLHYNFSNEFNHPVTFSTAVETYLIRKTVVGLVENIIELVNF